jgi:hypothetical protein|tara:strand:- start:15662 stop:16030 length:369 start_codon:yes stop_codon:yes gene_type:complete
MAMTVKLFDLIKDILEHRPETRDSDNYLAYRLYTIIDKDFHPTGNIKGMSVTDFFSKLERENLPSISSINRARRKVQEVHPSLRGKKYEVRQRNQKRYIQATIDYDSQVVEDFHNDKLKGSE